MYIAGAAEKAPLPLHSTIKTIVPRGVCFNMRLYTLYGAEPDANVKLQQMKCMYTTEHGHILK